MELGQDLQNMQGSINQLLAILWPELFVIAAFAFLLTAFLQVLKDIVPIRVMFQKFFLLRWIRRRILKAAKSMPKAAENVEDTEPLTEPLNEVVEIAAEKFGITKHGFGETAEVIRSETVNALISARDSKPAALRHEIAELTTENNVRALCSLRADQLAGQLTTAAQHVTDYPQGRMHLLVLFAADAKLPDILATHFGALAAAKLVDTGSKRSQTSDGAPEQEPPWLAEFDDAKNRIQYHVQRAIDQLMISMGNIWSRLLRAVSVILGLAVVLLYFAFGVQTDRLLPNTAGEVLVVVTIGIASGYLASVFHDILMRLQGGRGRE